MADAAYLPASSSALRGSSILAGYLAAPGAAHPWSIDDWHRGRTMPNVGAIVPIYVYATGQRNPDAAADSAAAQSRELGAPDGSVVVLDVEQGGAAAAHRDGFPTAWAEGIANRGLAPWVYTSASTHYTAGGVTSWLADWTDAPHILPGSIATQWASPTVDRSLEVDLSDVDPRALRSLIPATPGKVPNMPELAAPIVAMAERPQGDGYWLVGSDGGVFAFGNAHAGWGLGAKHINAPIVAAASSHTGNGLILVGADGGVFAFGDAAFHGSVPGDGIAPHPGTPGDPTP